MKKVIALILVLLSATSGYSQITGKIIDLETNKPVSYSNIWIKNTKIGTTSDTLGTFNFKRAKIGDTLKVSSLGYEEFNFIAKGHNEISIKPVTVELDEVVLSPMKDKKIKKIISYDKKKDVKDFYTNGHYSIARYFKYNKSYKANPYIKNIKTVVWNAKREKVNFKMYLVKADKNGNPTNILLTKPQIFNVKVGIREVKWNLKKENVSFPEDGFCIVIDRLNLDKNKYSNEYQKNILQPAIGMESIPNAKNTLLRFSANWIKPDELTKHVESNNNIAINIELTD